MASTLQMVDKSCKDNNQANRGHIPRLYTFNFCLVRSGDTSTLRQRSSSLHRMLSLTLSGDRDRSIGRPSHYLNCPQAESFHHKFADWGQRTWILVCCEMPVTGIWQLWPVFQSIVEMFQPYCIVFVNFSNCWISAPHHQQTGGRRLSLVDEIW